MITPNTCSETFITKQCLKAHNRKHDGTMLQCQACGKQFSRTQQLNVHVKFVHLQDASTRFRSERRRELKLQKLAQTSQIDLSLLEELHKNNLAKINAVKLEKKKEEDIHMCAICGKLFKKLSKQKIHMVTHTQLFRNLTIANNIVWSKDRTKMSCINCGMEFKQHGHMKVHIALVHYHLQNIGNFDAYHIDDIVKSNGALEYNQVIKQAIPEMSQKEHKKVECQECGKKYSRKSLRDHLLNVHIRKPKNQIGIKPQEENLLSFLT